MLVLPPCRTAYTSHPDTCGSSPGLHSGSDKLDKNLPSEKISTKYANVEIPIVSSQEVQMSIGSQNSNRRALCQLAQELVTCLKRSRRRLGQTFKHSQEHIELGRLFIFANLILLETSLDTGRYLG